MKGLVARGVVCSVIYLALFFALVAYRNRNRTINDSFLEIAAAIAIMVFAALLVFMFLSYLVKQHTSIKNAGWKRLLLVVFVVLTSYSMYFVYDEVRASDFVQLYLSITGGIAFSYALTVTPYVVWKWVADGFKNNNISE